MFKEDFNMKKFVLILSMIFVFTLKGISQNEIDALRYSQTYFGGSARSVAMAGSFNALGADISTLHINPAGIGLFRSSEFTVTPSLIFNGIETNYLNNTKSDSKAQFSFQNLGIVWASNYGTDKTIKGAQFSISYQKIADFNNRMLVEGFNQSNSITDMFVEMAVGHDFRAIEEDKNSLYSFDLHPAWWTYMFDYDSSGDVSNPYFSYIPNGNILQRNKIHTWGGIKEIAFTFGANVSDKLYTGFSIGLPMIDYHEISTYYEIDELDLVDDFINLQINDELVTEGSGINLKFGLIYNPVKFLRLGAAIHSPTWYTLQDSWQRYFSTQWVTDPQNPTAETPLGFYEYNLETPWKANGSIGFIIGKRALINFDYEYIDYSNAKLRADDYDFDFVENQAIKTSYSTSSNFRVGAEYNLGVAAIRGGYAYYGSPYRNDLNDGSTQFFTGGLGFRAQNLFVDIAYLRSIKMEDYYLYTLNSQNEIVNPVNKTVFSNQFLVTLGVKF